MHITDEFFDGNGVPISSDAETDANAELDPAVLAAIMGMAPPTNEIEDNNEDEVEEESTESEGVEVEITVGECQFGKVTKMMVNPLCLKDVCALGRKKMLDSNVGALRHKRKQRTRRERDFLQTSLLNMLNGTTGSHTRELVSCLQSGGQTEQPSFCQRYQNTN